MAILYPNLDEADDLIRTLIITGVAHRLHLHGQSVDKAVVGAAVDTVLRSLAAARVKPDRNDIIAACTASMLKVVQSSPEFDTMR